MANDLHDFLQKHNLQHIVLVGHSMGGKTAMKFAQHHPESVNKLVVVDIAPKRYSIHHREILEGLLAIDLEVVKDRSEAEELIATFVPEFATRQFLSKNLYWIEKGKLAWRFNLPVISKQIAEAGEATGDEVFDAPTLFITGEHSDYITGYDEVLINELFPNSRIETIAGAGHWVHSDQPEKFVKVLKEFATQP